MKLFSTKPPLQPIAATRLLTSSKRSRSDLRNGVSPFSFFLGASLIGMALLASGDHATASSAAQDSGGSLAATKHATAPPMEARKYFALYPSDKGAWQFEDLNKEEQGALEAAQEWAEEKHGADVHSRFRILTAKRATEARAQRAERWLGLYGLREVPNE